MKTAMIVEDNPSILMVLQKRFTQAGFNVETIQDGFALLTRLGQKTHPAPDVVILDVMLPGRSGHELLDRINSTWPAAKVFIFSAHAEYRRMMRNVAGFFLKTDGVENLVAAAQESVAANAKGPAQAEEKQQGQST